MKAALLLEPGKIAIQDIPEPSLGEDDVLLEPVCAGICGTDVSFYLGHREVPLPFVLGHEIMGRVSALGPGVTKLRPGQRVIVEPNYPCGTCRLCRAGRGAVCPQKKSMGVNVPGCFSQRVLAPAEFVWPLPDSVSDQDGAAIEPLAVSVRGLLQSGARAGDTVAVLGCGVVGQLLIHAAVAAGIRVIASDQYPEKQETALRLGAWVALGSKEAADMWEAESVSAVFECAGSPATVELALRAAPRGSQIVLLGLPSDTVSFSPMRLVREGIQIRTSMIYDHPGDFAYVIDRVARGALQPGRVVTHTYPLERIGEAMELAAAGKAGKIHIRMP